MGWLCNTLWPLAGSTVALEASSFLNSSNTILPTPVSGGCSSIPQSIRWACERILLSVQVVQSPALSWITASSTPMAPWYFLVPPSSPSLPDFLHTVSSPLILATAPLENFHYTSIPPQISFARGGALSFRFASPKKFQVRDAGAPFLIHALLSRQTFPNFHIYHQF